MSEALLKLEGILAGFPSGREELLPLLHRVQAEMGCVAPEWVGPIAQHFNLSRAEVHGVVTFYHDFRESPRAGRRLAVCVAEACQAVGARQIVSQIEAAIQCRMGEASADGRVSLEPVYCLGLCACAPALMLDGSLHGRVTAEKLPVILDGVIR